jgi:ACS family tartrate transporter-like MFS transporter
MPFLFLLYIVCYLDRLNIGFAALQMNNDLGFSASVYGFGAGVFFLGYALLEVPSNLLLSRVGARRWIARIMISWGVLASRWPWCEDLEVSTFCGFYSARQKHDRICALLL